MTVLKRLHARYAAEWGAGPERWLPRLLTFHPPLIFTNMVPRMITLTLESMAMDKGPSIDRPAHGRDAMLVGDMPTGTYASIHELGRTPRPSPKVQVSGMAAAGSSADGASTPSLPKRVAPSSAHHTMKGRGQ